MVLVIESLPAIVFRIFHQVIIVNKYEIDPLSGQLCSCHQITTSHFHTEFVVIIHPLHVHRQIWGIGKQKIQYHAAFIEASSHQGRLVGKILSWLLAQRDCFLPSLLELLFVTPVLSRLIPPESSTTISCRRLMLHRPRTRKPEQIHQTRQSSAHVLAQH